MNLILFDAVEIERPLAPEDPRTVHVRQVLRRQPGDLFDCGLVNGPRGRARVERIDAEGLHLTFAWEGPPPPLPPVCLLVGMPRPQTARRILHEAAALGVGSLCFFASDRSEPSYADSRLWTTGEVDRHLRDGAAQAFCTRLPECHRVDSLADALRITPAAATHLALDNYEATVALARLESPALPAVLALGAERGWSTRERALLRDHGFVLAHLGARVLRVETACIASLTLLRARLGLLDHPAAPSGNTSAPKNTCDQTGV